MVHCHPAYSCLSPCCLSIGDDALHSIFWICLCLRFQSIERQECDLAHAHNSACGSVAEGHSTAFMNSKSFLQNFLDYGLPTPNIGSLGHLVSSPNAQPW